MPRGIDLSHKKHALPSDEYLKKLGARIRSLRISRGYTNYDKFAYEHDIDRSQWGRFENGKDLRFTSLLQIVSVFDMTLEEFFSEGFEAK
ncbi:helix-turn-helix transcriptional regulator [Pedobacter sp. KBS0701]|uniref:helix-turn-helix transcriptional regulator n=1 Tax=Pedobacter sp. KBS0701 TaxID=2578106 RepID=UPI00110F4966|nr:helix-turn-helix transcriptional regulator [Pedobacter sp. KBS0701]QDW27257.1 helix-turn-helix transcriptional regulator [Pedobacter sp. KBS0701]